MTNRKPRGARDELESAVLDVLGVRDRWTTIPVAVYAVRERYGQSASSGEVASVLARLCRERLVRRSAE
jgi:hypothetical protein